MADYGLPAAMVVALMVGIFSGYPVGFVLGGIGVIFLFLGDVSPYFLQTTVSRIYGGVIANWLLLAVPLFVFMGLMLDSSGIARNLLYSLERLLGKVRGGLGISVAVLGVVMAASTGIIGASVVMLGVLALPVMLKERYAPTVATGVIAASGTLGILIPPSIMLVVLGAMLQISVGDLFKGAILPGLVLAGLYVGFLILLGRIRPGAVPPVASPESSGGNVWLALLRDLMGPVVLIGCVLGSILAGLATPTEAAAVGALGASILALLNRSLDMGVLKDVVLETGRTTAMIFFVLIGATCFSAVFKQVGGDTMIEDAVAAAGFGAWGTLFLFMAVLFVLGCFMEWIEITFVVLPLFAPIMAGLEFGAAMSFDQKMIWFAILVAVNLQTSFLTPPFGFALFYLKGVAPEGINIATIYRGVIPFVLLQLTGLALVLAFPGLVLALL